MNIKNLLLTVLMTSSVMPAIAAQTEDVSISVVDQKIANIVGLNNVAKTKKIARTIVIGALAAALAYFGTRAICKPYLKHQYSDKTEDKAWGASTVSGKVMVNVLGLKDTVVSPKEIEPGCVKSMLQKFYFIKKYDKNDNPIISNWEYVA